MDPNDKQAPLILQQIGLGDCKLFETYLVVRRFKNGLHSFDILTYELDEDRNSVFVDGGDEYGCYNVYPVDISNIYVLPTFSRS